MRTIYGAGHDRLGRPTPRTERRLPVTLDLSSVTATLRAAGCVYAEAEAELLISAAATAAELDALVERRVGGLPLEQVVGWADFCGLRLDVAPGVFVPRIRSEFLVRAAVRSTLPGDLVLDLCCGSGAVGAALAARVGRLRLHAVDIDAVATRCAQANVARVGGTVHTGDLYAALPAELRGHVDVIVANAPYVPSAELALLPAEARDYEPRIALDGGVDGVTVQRRVARDAPLWLVAGGTLLIETSDEQAALTMAAMTAAGLTARVTRDAELEATVVVGTAGRQPAMVRRD